MDNPPAPRGNIDWDKIKDTLTQIQDINPAFTTENALIGGSAAWFYRTLLEKSQDQDFPCPNYTEEEKNTWLSKDIDFIGTRKEDIGKELGLTPEGNPPTVKLHGVWIDTPNEGVFLTKTRASKTALEVRNPTTQSLYKIASPILLFREKKELETLKKEKRPQDALHLRTLKQAAKLTICKLAEEKDDNPKQATLLFKLLKEAQEIAPELLQDKKLTDRLEKQVPRFLANPHTKALYHLLVNQILPKKEVGMDMD